MITFDNQYFFLQILNLKQIFLHFILIFVLFRFKNDCTYLIF
jgi:hypothetical protein